MFKWNATKTRNGIYNTANKAGYKNYLIWSLYKKWSKNLNHIENAQKPRKLFTNAIPFNRNAFSKIKNEAVKLNYHIPIKPNLNIFQRIRKDQDSINPLETSSIYQIDFEEERGEKCSYIGKKKN